MHTWWCTLRWCIGVHINYIVDHRMPTAPFRYSVWGQESGVMSQGSVMFYLHVSEELKTCNTSRHALFLPPPTPAKETLSLLGCESLNLTKLYFSRHEECRIWNQMGNVKGQKRMGGVCVVNQEGSFYVVRFLQHERRADSSAVLRTNFSMQKCIRRVPDPMVVSLSWQKRG